MADKENKVSCIGQNISNACGVAMSLGYIFGSGGCYKIEWDPFTKPLDSNWQCLQGQAASNAIMRDLSDFTFSQSLLCEAWQAAHCTPPNSAITPSMMLQWFAEYAASPMAGCKIYYQKPMALTKNSCVASPEQAEEYFIEPRGFIRIEVVDDESGQPMSNVLLSVFPPDGSERKRTTGSDGIIFIERIERGSYRVTSPLSGRRFDETLNVVEPGGGTTEVSGDGTGTGEQNTNSNTSASPTRREPCGAPRSLATITAHRVRTGETLAALAQGCDLTWGQLAYFNWGTYKPQEINEHLRVDVGCTKKTHDKQNYIFDDKDEPGIVYLPRPWSREGLPTNETHTIRVRRVQGHIRPFGLCCTPFGIPIKGKLFVIKEDGNEIFSGTTDADGLINAPFIHDMRYEVWFPKITTSQEQ